jgi:carbamoyl-phosphate synthase/aspartate carbamoyltransferase
VSTDYDESDRLYFEELSCERVLDIYEHESGGGSLNKNKNQNNNHENNNNNNKMMRGVIVSVGGQTAQNLSLPLKKLGVHILGTDPADIDRAEDRHKFSALLDRLGVDQPPWRELCSMKDALEFAQLVSYPVLVRPSFVLSGAAMNVAANPRQLEACLEEASTVSGDKPVVVSKFITNAKEIEFDAVASEGRILNYAISEHVENAGVHSGDATLVLPAQNLYQETVRRIKKIGQSVAAALHITGPFNMQLMAKANAIKVIECNLRASRTFPFVSKTLNANFATLATRAMLGEPNLKPFQISLGDIDYVGVKAAMFSFTRLKGADPVLGVEMSSTGEVS